MISRKISGNNKGDHYRVENRKDEDLSSKEGM